jgi:hypothetical protein
MPNLFLELRNADDASTIGMTPAPLGEKEALEFMSSADFTAVKLIPWGSNYSFAVVMEVEEVTHLAIYKPRAGEAPLHDFRHGTLYKREVASYRLSRWLGWDLVPPTIAREGPHGTGSVQIYIEPGGDLEDPESFWGATTLSNERVVLFDHIANNADRKLTHCLVDTAGKVWGIDHGLTFNQAPKLRTVMWQFCDEPISPALRRDLERLVEEASAIEAELQPWLTEEEIAAFHHRVTHLLRSGCYPRLNPYRNIPYGWW